jgi:hypothetical protein
VRWFYAIASPHAIVPLEIECALIERFHLDLIYPTFAVFGRGRQPRVATRTLSHHAPERCEASRFRRTCANWRLSTAPPRPSTRCCRTLAHSHPCATASGLQVHTRVRLTDGKFVHGQNSVRERHTELGAPT